MIEIAVPTKTVLIVIMIGVTLFFEIVDIKKQREDTVNITIVDVNNARKNLNITSSSDKNSRPL